MHQDIFCVYSYRVKSYPLFKLREIDCSTQELFIKVPKRGTYLNLQIIAKRRQFSKQNLSRMIKMPPGQNVFSASKMDNIENISN